MKEMIDPAAELEALKPASHKKKGKKGKEGKKEAEEGSIALMHTPSEGQRIITT